MDGRSSLFQPATTMIESSQMNNHVELIDDLQTLNKISLILNQSNDVKTALNASLVRLVELMGLETGWIFVLDPAANDRWDGRGFRLIAHHNLPEALDVSNPAAWSRSGRNHRGWHGWRNRSAVPRSVQRLPSARALP